MHLLVSDISDVFISDAEGTATMIGTIKAFVPLGRYISSDISSVLYTCVFNREVNEQIPLTAVTTLQQLPDKLLPDAQVRCIDVFCNIKCI